MWRETQQIQHKSIVCALTDAVFLKNAQRATHCSVNNNEYSGSSREIALRYVLVKTDASQFHGEGFCTEDIPALPHHTRNSIE